MVISASFLVLVLVSLLFGSIEYFSIRQRAAEEQRVLALIVGNQLSKPLLNANRISAKEIIATLASDSRIHAAYLFDGQNRPFAQYLDANATKFVERILLDHFSQGFPADWLLSEIPIDHYDYDHMGLYAPIFFQGSRIGSLYLVSDLSAINQKLFGLLTSVLLAGGAAIGLAWGLSGRLSRPVSQPILQLVRTMSRISATGSYRLRAEKSSDDEIGQLVDGFNDMLTQIEVRDRKIEAHQKFLEQTVRERTARLTETVSELAEAKKQSDEANQAKSVFLANMTHELRTPLVGVLGMNELLLESSLDAQQRILAETVQRSGQDLLELINSILDFSRLERGSLELKSEPVALPELVEEALSAQAEKCFAKGLELTCRITPEAAWRVRTDPRRLRQILSNLLDNAIKFTARGAVGLELRLGASGDFLFEVSDTGIGIDPQRQTKIFEAFAQADDSTSRMFGGAGLGLSLVLELSNLLGGRITLESKPGEGSVFTLALPLERLELQPPNVPDPCGGRSVILCCARSRSRESMRLLLLDFGFSVHCAADTDELLRRLEGSSLHAESFDLVFLVDVPGTAIDPALILRILPHCRQLVCLRHGPAPVPQDSRVIELRMPLLRGDLVRGGLYRENASGALPEVEPEKLASLKEIRSEFGPLAKRILVVDDNVSTRELIKFSLADKGWRTEEAANAAEALSAVGQRDYCLILMDVNMPGIDGLEATRQIRAGGIGTPIFALTAHGEEAILTECIAAGMQGVLRKPFRQRELFDLLEQQLPVIEGEPDLSLEHG